MEIINNWWAFYLALNINPKDGRKEDALRAKVYDYSNCGITVLPDSIGVRLVGWGRENGDAIMEGDTSITYHRTLAYPFTRDEFYEAMDEMEEQICGVGFTV